MKCIVLLVMLSICLTSSSLICNGQKSTPEPASNYQSTVEYIKKKSEILKRKNHLPALAVTLVEDQEIIYQDATGLIDIENNIPATTKSVFKLWSLAKVFTAIEIFREVEEDLIDLDSPVTDWLPEFYIQSRFINDKEIKLNDLLAHRSGLPRHAGLLPKNIERDYYMLEQFEFSTPGCYKAYPTGYRYKYSNLGYDLLGRVIEKTRKDSYYRYMQEELLSEIGMKNSVFHTSVIDDSLRIAKGYMFHRGKYSPYIQYDINSAPSGNLYSTIEDLSCFLKAIFGNDIFREEGIMSEMFIDNYSSLEDPETMGMGWKTARMRNNDLLVWHDGGPSEGIGSLVAFLPQHNIGIALIGNGTSFSGAYSLPFARDILYHLLQEKYGLEKQEQEYHDIMNLDNDILKSYEGNYVAFGKLTEVKSVKDFLRTKIGGIPVKLKPVKKDEFIVSSCLDKVGLLKLFNLPIQLKDIRIRFINTDSVGSSCMIIDFDKMSYEICPVYPDIEDYKDVLLNLPGDYKLADRLQNNEHGNLKGMTVSIKLEEGALIMSGVYGPIMPLDKHHLLIMGGPYAGETIEYNSEAGKMFHHKTAFLKLSN